MCSRRPLIDTRCRIKGLAPRNDPKSGGVRGGAPRGISQAASRGVCGARGRRLKPRATFFQPHPFVWSLLTRFSTPGTKASSEVCTDVGLGARDVDPEAWSASEAASVPTCAMFQRPRSFRSSGNHEPCHRRPSAFKEPHYLQNRTAGARCADEWLGLPVEGALRRKTRDESPYMASLIFVIIQCLT